MMKRVAITLAFASAPALSETADVTASAWQEQVQSMLELQKIDQQVADVGWRIVSSGLRFCPVHRPSLGISLHEAGQYAAEYRQAAVATFGMDGIHPSVQTVAAGSPAQRAGVLPNDIMLSLNEQAMPRPEGDAAAAGSYAYIDKAMDQLESLPRDALVRLTLLRAGREIKLEIMPQEACASRVEMAPSASENSSANGKVALLYGALVIRAKSDDELALLAGHEIAHNILGHDARIRKQKIDTDFLPLLGIGDSRLRDMERDADSLGIWLAALAGYDYKIAPKYFSDITKRSGIGAYWPTTHPTARNRFRNAAVTVAKIDLQRLEQVVDPAD